MGRELEVLIHVGGLTVHFGRERAIIIITSKNGIRCPSSLLEVNWMLWLMEFMWAYIPSTYHRKDIIHISLPGTGDVLRARSSTCSITISDTIAVPKDMLVHSLIVVNNKHSLK